MIDDEAGRLGRPDPERQAEGATGEATSDIPQEPAAEGALTDWSDAAEPPPEEPPAGTPAVSRWQRIFRRRQPHPAAGPKPAAGEPPSAPPPLEAEEVRALVQEEVGHAREEAAERTRAELAGAEAHVEELARRVQAEAAGLREAVPGLVQAELTRQREDQYRAARLALQEMADEIAAVDAQSLRAELAILNREELATLQNDGLPLRERLELADWIRQRRGTAEKQIESWKAAAAQRLSGASEETAVAGPAGAGALAEVREELARQKETLDRLAARRLNRQWPALLGLLLIAAVGVAGILLPRSTAANPWGPLAGENLLPDGSFEAGTWQDEPGDCCAGNPGAARISFARTTDATDGRYALQLTSENHCTCVASRITQFEPGALYSLSLDYRSVEGTAPRYVIVQEGSNVYAPAGSLKAGKGWQHHQELFTTAPGTAGLSIYLYADSDGTARTVALYDNVRISKVGTD